MLVGPQQLRVDKGKRIGVEGDEAGGGGRQGQATRASNARLRGWTLFKSTEEPWWVMSRKGEMSVSHT